MAGPANRLPGRKEIRERLIIWRRREYIVCMPDIEASALMMFYKERCEQRVYA